MADLHVDKNGIGDFGSVCHKEKNCFKIQKKLHTTLLLTTLKNKNKKNSQTFFQQCNHFAKPLVLTIERVK